jgi:hypothetical protein
MLEDSQKSQLRNLVRSTTWQTILLIKDKKIEALNNQSVLRDTNDLTLREAITKEAKMEALNNFIQEILNQAT